MHYDLIPGLLPEDTLFIHGNLGSNRWWRPTVQILKSTPAETALPGNLAMAEWLGCGQSSAPGSLDDLQMMSLGRDYIELANGLGLDNVDLVGHSTGGLIALCAMAQAPELFRRAVLLDPVSPEGVKFGPEMYDAFTKMSEDRAFCDTVMAGTIHRCNVNDPLVQGLFEDAFHVDTMIWHGVADVLSQTDLRDEMSKVSHPVLILHGEHDPILPIDASKRLAKLLPNGKFLEIKGHGHSLNIENPSTFVDLMRDFLS